MLEIMISSSVLILVLAILRLVLRDKISARLQYALWLLVLVRLMVPVSFFQSPMSVAEATRPAAVRASDLSGTILYIRTETGRAPVKSADDTPQIGDYASAVPGQTVVLRDVLSVGDVLRWIWLTGSAVMAGWFLFVNLRFLRRVKKTRTPYDAAVKPPVYIAKGLPSPCLFGLWHPAIYLTERAAEDKTQARQIIAHEKTHLHHGDLIWAFLRSVCLTVWWFNPFVWLAAALSRQDCELACDEGTIKSLGEEARFDYGRTLVSMTAVGVRPSNLLCGATTMTSGKKTLKARVARIANAPKTSVAIAVAVLIIAAIAVGCTYGGPAAEPEADTPDALTPMIVVSGRLYCSTGEQLPMEVDPSAYAGGIASVVPSSEQPTEDDQANFGEVGDPYIMELSGPVVLMDNEWTRFVFADAANYLDPAPAPEVIADGVISAEVWGEGRTAELTEAEELKQLLTVMESIEFQQTFDLDHAYAPGAQSVGVTLSYEDGSEVRWTYPVMMYNGAIFESENQSAGTIGSFLYPELYAGTGSDILTDPETGEILAVTSSPEMAAETESVGGWDAAYWEEVERELGSFAEPADFEAFVGTLFIETIQEDAYPRGPLTFEDYIYGTDAWQFQYNEGELAGASTAWLILRDADGRELRIMDDADGMMIKEADGSITWVTVTGGLDCADMIRNLLPWARGEYPDRETLEQREEAAQVDTARAREMLGSYGLAGYEPVGEQGGMPGFPAWNPLGDPDGCAGPYLIRYYGTDDLSADLRYERMYAGTAGLWGTTQNADAFADAREYFAQTDAVQDVKVLSHDGFYVSGSVPRLVWYDAEKDLIFSLIAYHCDGGQVTESFTADDLVSLAETVE